MTETPKVVKDLLSKVIYNFTGITERVCSDKYRIVMNLEANRGVLPE
jgi:hypothetical protein